METRDGPEDETAICLAARGGNLEAVRCLMEYGADTNPVLQGGTTMHPLRSAMEWHHIETAKLLLKHMDLTTLPTDPNEQDLLLCTAVACGLEMLTRRLLEYGCDPEAIFLDYSDIGLGYEEGLSASVLAAALGHVKVLQLLLDDGADPDWPLLIAAERGQLQVVKMLLENGADADCRQTCCIGLLSFAISHEAIFRLLLEHGADFKARDEGDSLLMTAIKSGKVAVV